MGWGVGFLVGRLLGFRARVQGATLGLELRVQDKILGFIVSF